MYDILFAKTFLIVGGMLVITTLFARINKAYETTSEAIITIVGSFGFLFAIMFYDDSLSFKSSIGCYFFRIYWLEYWTNSISFRGKF